MTDALANILGYGSYGPAASPDSWWTLAWTLVFGAPWILGIACLWRRYRRVQRDSPPPPSNAELWRRRYSVR